MNEQMGFPKTIKEFIDDYSFKDKEEIYTNGSQLIQVFRVEQALDHYYQPYKDIEEELGIDLPKLFDCIRSGKGIWKRKYGDGNELINTRCMLTCEFGYWRVYDKETIYELKDYGKTWALTKEELL